MKALTRLLLVNWHYFQNTVIDFGNINFLTGKNSAGKSTIIDALQVVLMGETRSVAFNRAASKKSERTLKSYLIGSMGEDIENGNKSLRDGKDFSTYIVAEFYDDFKSAFFCLGAVFDTFADGSDINRRFFWLKNSIPANSFIENGKTMDSRRMTQFFKEKYPNKILIFCLEKSFAVKAMIKSVISEHLSQRTVCGIIIMPLVRLIQKRMSSLASEEIQSKSALPNASSSWKRSIQI